MKFYNDKNNSYYWCIIFDNTLTAIHSDSYGIRFYKNGISHNSKNADYVNYKGYKTFSLNGNFYGYKDDFNKESWRRFVKLQAFL